MADVEVSKKNNDYIKKVKLLIEEKNWCDVFEQSQGFCIACHHDNPLDMEFHHIGAKSNSDVVVSLCRNCHGRISRKQMKSWPDGWSYKNNKPQVVKDALVLRGISDLLRLISDRSLERIIQ
ncbi:MAG: hypothetical protein OEW78_07720 [Nitrosopumilus sp.]|uniref:hypothetical protein n=1 Tax=Nitrosopumilus sp. TaxID=2024843 RepID=UPI00246A765C|nr:hypothetical protein [Nitrosopumilus sp.]MDH5431751.1 hypothetical protein [Nitrosopumilus sp.]